MASLDTGRRGQDESAAGRVSDRKKGRQARIEGLIGPSFGSLAEADPLELMEAAVPFRELTRLEELTL
jgi:hypothetical protein